MDLMRHIEAAGFQILMVGGCVRDHLLNNGYGAAADPEGIGEPKDIDFATSATPDELDRILDGTPYKVVGGSEAQIARGVLTTLVNYADETYEVTTFRAELGYGGGTRRPIAVPAATFHEDTFRRDFTINAMGMTTAGDIVDHHGGKNDLSAGIIRAVGSADERFAEDPLRMLRALRFSTRYAFSIDNPTLAAIGDNLDLLHMLSGERLNDEMSQILVQKGGFHELMATDILPTIIPELAGMEQYQHSKSHHPEGNLANHYDYVFRAYYGNQLHKGDDARLVAWGVLFHDIAKPQTAEWVPLERAQEKGYNEPFHSFHRHEAEGAKLFKKVYADRLKFSSHDAEMIEWAIRNHLSYHRLPKMRASKVAKIYTHPAFDLLAKVAICDGMMGTSAERGVRRRIPRINSRIEEVMARFEPTAGEIKPPKGYGGRIMAKFGIGPGPEVGAYIAQAFEMVASGEAAGWDEALEMLE